MDIELQQFQGTWQVVRIATESGPVPDSLVRQLRYVFDGDRVTLYQGESVMVAGTVAIHANAAPKEIDVEMTEGPARGQVVRGIYEIAENRLRLCIGPDRAAQFSPAKATSVVELERPPSDGRSHSFG
jgi:uncharacterized protein (TIGR03067 family)